MNKILTFTLLTCGLLLLDIPEAAARKEVRNYEIPPSVQRGFREQQSVVRAKKYRSKGYSYDRYRGQRYYKQYRRSSKMPVWLKRNRSFTHWYSRSQVRRDRRLSWTIVFEIYQWQRSHRYYGYRY